MDTENYTSSIAFDKRLYKQDIAGSIAHVKMLAKQKIISSKEANQIIKGLNTIKQEIESNSFDWQENLEDIHMNIENRLFEIVGKVAGKLHTGRSRNDQVSTDMRLFVKEQSINIVSSIKKLQISLVKLAENNIDIELPGYTHLQRAQPILFSHHMMAYFEMFSRDVERFLQTKSRADVCTLGSGALAGTTYNIDREFVAKELGFSKISLNSMDAVSDRDFIIDFCSSAATCMVHISRLSEEIIIWTSKEFDFLKLNKKHTTGSSMMPQKQNPDYAELSRGRSARTIGNLMSILTLLKGLPLTYNRDLQEDKERLFDSLDTLSSTLNVIDEMVNGMKLNKKTIQKASEDPELLATDIADYLVKKGSPFREAYKTVVEIVKYSNKNDLTLKEFSLKDYQNFSKLFDQDIFKITANSSIQSRDVPGGTSTKQVSNSIKKAKIILEKNVE
tara:strand:- start:2659 stop:3999 length:1341 start_codon:yes stop_codon:yes gene_type:complete